MKGFLDFIRSQGVVGLTVGFLLGGAANDLVKSLIENVINPLLGLFIGRAEELTDVTFAVGNATVHYGAFLATLINFAVVAALIYFVIKKFGFEKIDTKKEEQK